YFSYSRCMTCGAVRCHVTLLFSYNVPATSQLYTLSLHDALPISISATTASATMVHPPPLARPSSNCPSLYAFRSPAGGAGPSVQDRKSTRLNSSHLVISYAVFCLKKKKNGCIPL